VGILKLALDGLAGVKETHVEIGGAAVVYDSAQITAADVVAAVASKTPFQAELRSDEPQPAGGGAGR
jgi:hypothetical protein